MFSILISVYKNDNATYFYEALNSISKQTYSPSQVVLVCDGPIDESLQEVIDYFTIQFFKLNIEINSIRLKKNMGLGYALSEGVKYCKNDFIVRMDSDDISGVKRLELTRDFINSNPGYAVYGSQIEEFKNKIGDLSRIRKVPLSNDDIIKFAKMRNPMNHVTVCINRKDLLSVGSYESVLYHEDYYLWVKFIISGKMLVNSSETLVFVRVGNDLIGRRKGISYFRYEVGFVNKCLSIGFMNRSEIFKYLSIRLCVRLLPKMFINYIYRILRR